MHGWVHWLVWAGDNLLHPERLQRILESKNLRRREEWNCILFLLQTILLCSNVVRFKERTRDISTNQDSHPGNRQVIERLRIPRRFSDLFKDAQETYWKCPASLHAPPARQSHVEVQWMRLFLKYHILFGTRHTTTQFETRLSRGWRN